MGFELFDPHEEYVVREGLLPHWFQPGVTYFVTFRTADSVPQRLIRSWEKRREVWLRRQGIDPNAADWRAKLHLNAEASVTFRDAFETEFANWLDQGLGECVLCRPELSEIVGASLKSGNGE